jgi:UDP-glucose 4-epimerase
MWADTTEIRQQLGWHPTVSFEDGVRIMLDHIESWRDAPVWNEASIAQATATWFHYLT